MNYALPQELSVIQGEYAAAKAATTHMMEVWPQVAGTPQAAGVTLTTLRLADDNLEKTYIIRLFAKFEDLLRDHLQTLYPGVRVPWRTEDLINRAASRRRVPDPIRDDVHLVRAYRNAIVHRPDTPVLAMPFAQALARLNKFLAWL